MVNENSESEAIKNLQESMKTTIGAIEQKLTDTTQELADVIEGKEAAIKNLSDEQATLQERYENLCKEKEEADQTLASKTAELVEQLKSLHSEKEDVVAENTVVKTKIDNLKAEKRDLEKTLEREIREKSELKTQVTNILQEIGRLEDQLKEVKLSHSVIQTEKQTLEEKIEKIQKQHTDAKNKLEKEANNKWQTKIKELEAKLLTMEGERVQMSSNNQRLQNEAVAAETRFKADKTELNLKLQELETLATGTDELKNQLAESEKKAKAVSDQLTQCTGDHAKLFNEKELLDHQVGRRFL
jgi:chromosome segregation ATPase